MSAPRAAALAGLIRISEPPVATAVGTFVDGVGAEEAWEAIVTRSAPPEVLASLDARLRDTSAADLERRAEEDVRVADSVGADLIGPGDDHWPSLSFEPLQWVAPYEKCARAWSPLALYRRGAATVPAMRGAVALIGSRAATPYGVRVATDFAAQAVDDGHCVISGAAFGIDAAAHRGALLGGADGHTLAVLACGIDRPYPAAHRSLIDAIAVEGTVLSEYPPGAVPARHRFLVRNRLIAALAEATIVVEAGRRSGSLNTASTAADLGRTVLAVPGPVTSAMSLGCHDLIRDGKAGLVASWADVRGLVGSLTPGHGTHRAGNAATDGLDLVTARVYEALPARGTADVDAIAFEAALAVPDVIGALAVLRTEGLAERRDGMWARSALPVGAPA